MTQVIKKALRAIEKTVHANAPTVQKRLSAGGQPVDPAILHSVAKYYSTLEKLAKQ